MMNDVVINVIAGPIIGRILKAFDESADVPGAVRRITKKEFVAGQDYLNRVKEAEVRLRQAEEENNEEKIRKETNYRKDRLEDAMSRFALSAGVERGIERCCALSYVAVCAAKLGDEGAARDELLRAKAELVPIRNELLNKGPQSLGIGAVIGTVGIAVCIGAGVYWLFGGWLATILVAAVVWLLSVLVVTSVSSKDANDLIEVCELGRKIAPDDPVASWSVPGWAVENATKDERKVAANPA